MVLSRTLLGQVEEVASGGDPLDQGGQLSGGGTVVCHQEALRMLNIIVGLIFTLMISF